MAARSPVSCTSWHRTLTGILLHLIFSTKHRLDLIPLELEADLYAYIGGICRELGSPLTAAGGTENHAHLLVSLSKTLAPADLLMHVKKDSSKWMKTKGVTEFGWQDGHAALSIGASQLPALRRYLARQHEHHRTVTFQEELLAFLEKYQIAYDPRYIWD